MEYKYIYMSLLTILAFYIIYEILYITHIKPSNNILGVFGRMFALFAVGYVMIRIIDNNHLFKNNKVGVEKRKPSYSSLFPKEVFDNKKI